MKQIKMNGQEVNIIYCLATETGYEQISGKVASDMFNPVFTYDNEGKVKKADPPLAKNEDYVTLGYAAIVAAYTKDQQQPPITMDYLMYEATPVEITELIAAVVELRNEWYKVPDVVKPETKKDKKPGKGKNA